jgi:hypothetical protein
VVRQPPTVPAPGHDDRTGRPRFAVFLGEEMLSEFVALDPPFTILSGYRQPPRPPGGTSARVEAIGNGLVDP